MILETLTVRKMQENCYLAGDPKALLVIDPGDEAEKIIAHIREKEYCVAYVVLTHCHYDHIGAVADVLEATGAKLVMGKAERDNYFDRHVSLCGYFASMPKLCEPDDLLADGDVIMAGAYNLRQSPHRDIQAVLSAFCAAEPFFRAIRCFMAVLAVQIFQAVT